MKINFEAVGTKLWRSLWAIALLGLSCRGATEPNQDSWVQATVVDPATTRTYEGNGQFYVSGPDPQYGVEIKFQVTSRGVGQWTGEYLYLARMGSGRPRVGVYELGPLRLVDGAWVGFRFLYSRSGEDGISESYVAREGALRVTDSTEDRVVGSFSFAAEIYCRMILTQTPPELPGYTCNPQQPHAGEAPLEVVGSFSVIRGATTPITDGH